jgi:hypothetical protein
LTFKEEMQGWMNEMARAYRAGDAHACAQMFAPDGQWLIRVCSLTSDEPPLLE